MTTEADPDRPAVVSNPTMRSSRAARRIVVMVGLGVVALVALAGWVLLVPYEVSYRSAAGTQRTVSCDVVPTGVDGRPLTVVAQACDDARSSRRTAALLAGAGVATVVCAVSTWPSRRLTGEALGPLR